MRTAPTRAHRPAARVPRPLAAGAAAGVVVLHLAAGLALAAPAEITVEAPTGAGGTAPDPRRSEVVTVVGTELTPLLGTPCDGLRVVAWDGARLAPIPHQVDERHPDEGTDGDGGTERGTYVLDVTYPPERDADGGLLDSNDEVVFMASDAGPPAPPGAAPAGAVAVELSDPLGGATRWAWVERAAEGAPRARDAYVRLDPATDSIESSRYGLTFSPAVPISWAYLTFLDDEGRPGPNVIDRFKMRIRADLLMGIIDFDLDEEDLDSTVLGYRAGPVRVIRRVQNRIDPSGLSIDPPTFSFDTVYYREAIHMPIAVLIPLELGFLVSDIDVETYLDFREIEGWKVRIGSDPTVVTVDGRMDEAERGLSLARTDWMAGYGPEVGMVGRIVLSEGLASVRTLAYYVDDVTRDDGPEGQRGLQPGVGFHLDDFQTVAKGTHEVLAEILFVPGLVAGDEAAILEGRARPLDVRTHPPAPTP